MGVRGERFSEEERQFMRRALALAERGYGGTSPNPMVGAVVVRSGRIIGEGWHERAGEPHAEVNALRAVESRRLSGASLYVTLEPCSTYGRTPPCTEAIIERGVQEVVVAATDPNPEHSGKGFAILRRRGIRVRTGLLADEANRLNEAFNFWVSGRRPWVVSKCAMSIDGKIGTNSGESRWITGVKARQLGMRLRLGADAIVVGINTVLRDDPALTLRRVPGVKIPAWKKWKRVVLDPEGRIPLDARLLADEQDCETIVAVSDHASSERVRKIEERVSVLRAPLLRGRELNLRWLLKALGEEGVASVLVEGGGETHGHFLRQALVNRVHFFYAPMVIGGRAAPKGVAGRKTLRRGKGVKLSAVQWSRVGPDLLCSALVAQ